MEKTEQFGEMIPKGAGDPIPLLKRKLLVGRRESCDIVLRFGNVSAHHCELTLESGYWFVRDLNSQNGTRVNGYRVTKRRIDPSDVLTVAKYEYEIKYSPADLGAVGPPPDGGDLEDILGSSLLESAGLNRKSRQSADGRIGRNRPASRPPIVTDENDDAEASPSVPAVDASEANEEEATDD
ncbi:MAG: FHA domain-containing protein [Planctomycetaceae bacterium]|nr:FHA domain-containing protein [Planctomycetales bacterium]MCB9923667.1 FHA domain-containing protein [Planctomycetaceae bacterium]